MNTLIRTTAASCLLLSAAAMASEAIDQTLPAEPDGLVEIYNVAGEVRVTGWDRDEVRVTGRLGKGVEEFIFEATADGIRIEVENDKHGRDGWADLKISAPARSRLDIEAVSAEVSVDGVDGEMSAHSVSGDVKMATASTVVDGGSVSGDVTLSGSNQTGQFELESVSGDIAAAGISGEVEAASVSGDIRVDAASLQRLSASSTSGDVRVAGAIGADARIEMETVSGEIDFDVVGKLDAEYELQTFSGSISTCFGPEPERPRFGPGESFEHVEGGGDARIEASAMSGDITICND